MTVYTELRGKYGHRNVRIKNGAFRTRKIENTDIIKDFLSYWDHAPKFEWPGQPSYIGTGLHYSKLSTIEPVEKQVCGNKDNLLEYQDTLRFDQPVVKNLLDRFDSFPLVRCKITEMKNITLSSVLQSQQGWHRDESPYEVLRVIIPLRSDLSYQFQLDNYSPEYIFPGYAYAFDQSVFHRVFSTDPSDLPRTHLILSFVTWYYQNNGEWYPNQFFGSVHPLDLFDLIPL